MTTTATMTIEFGYPAEEGLFPVEVVDENGTEIITPMSGMWPADEEADLAEFARMATTAGWSVLSEDTDSGRGVHVVTMRRIVEVHTAWATTAVSMPGTDPGVSVTRALVEGTYREEAGVVASWGSEDDAWGQDADDDTRLDTEAADTALTELGWTRTGDWRNSGGQWAADIERA